jgi:uncharacterized surface protein with fasciclin (FAS1) repeats
MKMNLCFIKRSTKLLGAAFGVMIFNLSVAQTNVYDDIIDVSPVHTHLRDAILAANLQGALQTSTSVTVFAPTNVAFEALAAQLDLTLAQVLALPNLSDILLYHVLGASIQSNVLTNGMTPQPLNTANTLKVTVTSSNSVFVNQAQVTTPDILADNGVVHVTNAVLLPNITVVDLAINNNFTILTTAVIQQELVPALSDPFASFTVFAPTDEAFEDALDALGITAAQLLASENLTDILLYHVLGAEVPSSAVTNGLLATPINDDNTIKMTLTSTGDVYANHAKVILADVNADNGVVHAIDAVILPVTTVVDLAINNDFTILTTAVVQQELVPALSNPFASFTVFAPTDEAFEDALDALGITAAQLLASENLTDILLYHVLGAEVPSSAVTNGLLATPINDDNTIKMTLTSTGDVFANQAKVILADVNADNGVVHAIDAVILPVTTVVDLAINNDFTILTTAVVQQELVPALSNPFASFTVFAPTDEAFEDALDALGITAAQLLASENLTDILLYHVLGAEVPSSAVTNGLIASPLSESNTIKLTKTGAGDIFANHAKVILADVNAFNGVVHAIDNVILPVTTVVDVAIDNEFTYLVTALIQEEFVPVLTNPLASFTVFAPTNQAFEELAAALETDIAGLLALDVLPTVLLYHVIDGVVASTDLANGSVNTLANIPVTVNIDNGVTINTSTVVLADVMAFNGIVHVLDRVLVPGGSPVSVPNFDNVSITAYPNPASTVVSFTGLNEASLNIVDINGSVVFSGIYKGNPIDISGLSSGMYFIYVANEQNTSVVRLSVK